MGRRSPRRAARPRRAAPVARAVLLPLLALLLLSAACSGTPTASLSSLPAARWQPVPLPAGAVPVTLTATGTALLVGAQTDTTRAPLLLEVTGSGTTVLPVRPSSPYAFLARWLDISDRDGALLAIGGARGGAHGNVRYTVWRGTLATGLVEEPQLFETFGGEDAGSLVAAVATGAGPVLLGTWRSEQTGLDAAVWLPDGTRWQRQSSTGTRLASTPTAMVGPRGAAAWGNGTLLVGSLLRLGDGVRQQPAVWRAATGATGWTRTDLPVGPAEAGQRGEAVSADCDPAGCLVAGWVGGSLALWRLDLAGRATRVAGVPAIPLSPSQALPAPVLTGDTAILLVPGRSGTRLLRVDSWSGTPRWSVLDGPAGTAEGLTVAAGRCFVLTGTGSGAATVWQEAARACLG